MPSYTVDYGGWIVVDAADSEEAFALVHEHLAHILDDFEIVNVEENDFAYFEREV